MNNCLDCEENKIEREEQYNKIKVLLNEILTHRTKVKNIIKKLSDKQKYFEKEFNESRGNWESGMSGGFSEAIDIIEKEFKKRKL